MGREDKRKVIASAVRIMAKKDLKAMDDSELMYNIDRAIYNIGDKELDADDRVEIMRIIREE